LSALFFKLKLMKITIHLFLLFLSLSAYSQWKEIEINDNSEWTDINVFNNEIIYMMSIQEIAKSSNGGESWQFFIPQHKGYFTSICFIDSNTCWVTSSFGEVIHTHDGGKSWEIISTLTAYFKDIYFINNQIGFVTSSAGEIFKSNDGGINWVRVYMVDGEIAERIQFTDQNHGWCCTYEGTLAITKDGGQEWTKITSPQIYNTYFIDELNGWGVDYFGNVQKSNDGGKTWDIQNTGFDKQLMAVKFISSKEGWAIGGSDCSGSTCIPYHKILYTINGGEIWETQDVLGATNSMRINDIDFVRLSNNNVKVFVCGAEGKIWTKDYLISGVVPPSIDNNAKLFMDNSQLHIVCDQKIMNISIYSFSGKTVYQNSDNVKTVNFSYLPLGFYIVKLTFETQEEIHKIKF
jgi:photosystem II stability/assembly factor-like uncharacterized protein